MIKIVFNHLFMYPNALLMLMLFVSVCTATGHLWIRLRAGKWQRFFFVFCMILLIVLYTAGMLFGRDVKHDEIEHAHSAWLISQGELPYIDFFQHHSPLFWILLAPVFKLPWVDAHICLSIRIAALLLSTLAVIAVCFFSIRIWGRRFSWIIFGILLCGHFLTVELNILRPDLLANGLIFSALILMTGRENPAASFGTGILMGLTLALSLKYLPLLVIFPVFLILQKTRFRVLLTHSAIYMAGGIAGLLPLIVWLKSRGLMNLFVQWVIQFNSGLVMGSGRLIHPEFPLLLTLLAIAGCTQLMKSEKKGQRNGLLLITLIVCASLIAIKPSRFHYDFYEQVYVLSALAASVYPFSLILSVLIRNHRMTLVSVCVAIMIWPGLHTTQRMIRSGEFQRGCRLIQALQKLPEDEPVVCLPPNHPVIRHDACYISQGVLYTRWLSHPDVHIRLEHLAEQLISEKPAIFFDRLKVDPQHRTFTETLYQNRLLAPDEKKQLDAFLKTEYRKVSIEDVDFLLRNDLWQLWNQHSR